MPIGWAVRGTEVYEIPASLACFRLFFFSSRRRHTRSKRDWSSDVCSSDLCRSLFDADPAALFLALYRCLEALYAYSASTKLIGEFGLDRSWTEVAVALEKQLRSEERRVGKECRGKWARYQ